MMHGMGFGMWWLYMLLPLLALGTGVLLLLRQRSDRSRQLPEGLTPETRVYQLAAKHHGRVTVSDLVVHLGMPSTAAEQLLQSMVDNQRIRMEVLDDGRVVYEFGELLE